VSVSERSDRAAKVIIRFPILRQDYCSVSIFALPIGGTYNIVLLFGRFLLKGQSTLFDSLLKELQFFFMIATFRGCDESEPDYGY
jgi:hypothetical protein